LRGDVPFHAYFVDGKWAPNQASGSAEPDTDRTSLLVAIIDVLADYVETSPVGKELYQLIQQKLAETHNFDWG